MTFTLSSDTLVRSVTYGACFELVSAADDEYPLDFPADAAQFLERWVMNVRLHVLSFSDEHRTPGHDSYPSGGAGVYLGTTPLPPQRGQVTQ